MNEPAFDPARVPIRPAATVVVVRDAVAADAGSGVEVLLVCRNRELAFHGGSWVFPGGRVDDEELVAAGGDEVAAARLAAVREVAEETGLDIAEDVLVPFSHWTTPMGRNRRFSTAFFLAPASAGEGHDGVAIDLGEIHDYGWFTPERAVALSEAGDIQLAGPTYVSLLRLVGCPSVAAAVALVSGQPYRVFRPRLHRDGDGVSVSVYEEDVAYESGDLEAAGPRHRMISRGLTYEYLWVESGPAAGEAGEVG